MHGLLVHKCFVCFPEDMCTDICVYGSCMQMCIIGALSHAIIDAVGIIIIMNTVSRKHP